ncbi:MAG TPA: YbaK/EbsC family protein [Candidatus Sumerlaeota bacterium]|nr:YbaK/EbsC family protein [Candidatus Sumerlaeota bacterium]
MPVEKLRAYLDENAVKYVSISHSRAYTAAEVAASAHIPGKKLAKVVMVKLDGKMAMYVTTANERLDLDLLGEACGAKTVELADEAEFIKIFPDCEIGAMPPFGNIYGMEVFVDESLTNDKEIAFNAGSHTELFRLAYKDFERLVGPTVV